MKRLRTSRPDGSLFSSACSLLLVAPVAVLCACSTLSSSQRGLPGGEVALRFAWPESLSAKVTHRLVMKDTLGSVTEGRRTYWWRLEPGTPEGTRRLVARSDEVSPEGLGALMDPEVTILFDRKGDFLGVEQSEEAPAMGLLEVLPLSPALQTQVRQTVDAALDAMARKRWDQRVGRWRGIALMPGEMVLRETRMWVGQSSMQREEVKAEVSTFLMEGVPCMQDMQDRRCVRLFVETVPARSYRESDPCERARALERFELVTDPDTLLPYMTRTLRKDEMDSCEKNGTVSTREMFQMEEFVFAYGEEPTSTGTHSL